MTAPALTIEQIKALKIERMRTALEAIRAVVMSVRKSEEDLENAHLIAIEEIAVIGLEPVQ